MEIRDATPSDWDAIFPFYAQILTDGRTYAYPPDLPSDRARDAWMHGPPGRTVVAVLDGALVGTATMGPNRPAAGAHIATGSFMVDPACGGRGVGRALGQELIGWAGREGYRGIQFNAVVQTNLAAVRLWQALGFEVVGTVPGAFRLPEGSYTGLHVMFRSLLEQ